MANPKDNEQGNDFSKARRNLLIMSVFVIVYFSGNMKFKYISVLGTEIKVDDPKSVSFWIVIFFCYFFFRYVGLFNFVNGWSVYKISLEDELQQIQERYAFKHFEKALTDRDSLSVYDDRGYMKYQYQLLAFLR